MKKHLLVLMMMILPACGLMAQIEIKGSEAIKEAPKKSNDPLYVVQGDKKVFEYTPDDKNKEPKLFFDVLKPEWIDSVSVIRPEAAIAKYGERAQFGAVIFSLSEGKVYKLIENREEQFTESKP